MRLILAMFFILFSVFPGEAAGQCGTDSMFLSRPYHHVAFLTTHNSFNAGEDGFFLPNQHYGISRQLSEGVRALMIDVYMSGGIPVVYHGFPFMGSRPLSGILDDVREFLHDCPSAVVTLIIENHAGSAVIGSAMNDAGLTSFLYAFDPVAGWPSIGRMIASGKRLVVFSETDDAQAGQDWYHYIWDFAVETDFSVSDTSAFSLEYNRGDSLNPLFILNHFATTDLIGTGSETKAAQANSYTCLMNRVQRFLTIKSKFANFITLDFYDLGDGPAVTRALNETDWLGTLQPGQISIPMTVWPNPACDFVFFRVPPFARGRKLSIILCQSSGMEVVRIPADEEILKVYLPSFMNDGVYIAILFDEKGGVEAVCRFARIR